MRKGSYKKTARTGLCCLLLGGMLVAGCRKEIPEEEPGESGDGIVRVGTVELTEGNLWNLLPAGEKTPFSPEEKALYVDRWIETEVLYQEALKRGINNDPKIKARIESLEREFLADHLLFLELRDRITVSEEEIREYFEQHRNEYTYEYRVSHILVNTLEEAESIQELLKSKSFAWVANRHSVDPVARQGGDLGYLTKGNMIPAFETVIFEMTPGEVSGIIKSDFGYHIIKLTGTRESQVKVYLENVREKIMNMLVMEKRAKAYADFIAELKQLTDIEYYKNGYDRIRSPLLPEEGVDQEIGEDQEIQEDDRTTEEDR
ncbi:MAG: peptidylprolyl isomerase [Candidatus Krumholzibacteriota bacterium]|nr:peptidylprolyl isomerase [Candidatus Krumholzibacteriota bacterium]